MQAPVSECQIDDDGVFKYIQIQVTNLDNKEDTKIIIRGTAYFNYHDDIFRNFFNKIYEEQPDLMKKYDFSCIGGGRIERGTDHVLVYGYSSKFGQCNHDKTVEILKRHLPSYLTIEASYGGY